MAPSTEDLFASTAMRERGTPGGFAKWAAKWDSTMSHTPTPWSCSTTTGKIGRASCRERVKMYVVDDALKKKLDDQKKCTQDRQTEVDIYRMISVLTRIT